MKHPGACFDQPIQRVIGENADSVTNVYAARFMADDAGWREASRLDEDTSVPSFTPQVAITGSSEAVVIWVTDSGPSAQVMHSVFTEDG